MAWKKNNPGCNASGGCQCVPGEPCEICGGSCLPSDIIAGSATIGSEDVTVTASNSIVLSPSNASGATPGARVSSKFVANNADDVVRLLVKYKDTDNYWYAELIVGTSKTFRIFERSGGASTQRASATVTTAAGAPYTLRICYGGGVVSASLNGSGVAQAIAFATATTATDAPRGGVATGSLASQVVFSEFLFEYAHSSGCPVCSCDVGTDDFNRANSTDITTGSPLLIFEAAGDWSIGSNKLQVSDAGAVALGGVALPDASDGFFISVAIDPTTAGNRLRMIFNYVDADNYMFAEAMAATGGIGLVRFVERAGGVETELIAHDGGNLLTSTFATTCTLCYNPTKNRISFQANSFGISLVNVPPPMTAAGTWGIGTGASISGTQSFDNLTVRRTMSPCALCAEPVGCKWDSPNELVVELAGTTNSGCSDCASFNGLYTVTFAARLSPIPQEGLWFYRLPTPICGKNFLMVYTLLNTITGNLRIAYDIKEHILVDNTDFPAGEMNLGDCTGFSGSTGGSIGVCNDTAVTMTVSLP